ncbi:hypothetical protein CBOM_03742 [Ceraceosorus bombacis]|uniref:Uncharacterized protein n=1 Tax=Ceraceosorus bombacis TaxID=401625 RepID=A0A0P1BID1_9BASI|nr:hypothetical protein CBOM_03742 [Ceraceosorus bombacis]
MHSVAVRRPTLIHRASTSSLSTDPSHSKEDGFSAPQTPNMPCGPPLGNSSTAASPVSAESHTVRQFKEAFHLDLGGKGSPVPLSLMPSPLIERSNPFSHAFGMSVKAAASPYAPSLSPPTNRSHAEARKQSRFASGWL